MSWIRCARPLAGLREDKERKEGTKREEIEGEGEGEEKGRGWKDEPLAKSCLCYWSSRVRAEPGRQKRY